MEPVHQEPSDLVLAVTRQELLCPLTVIEGRTVDHGSWQFNFYIIGESHLVRVERDGVLAWQEILACVTLPAFGLLHHHRFTSLNTHHWRFNNYATRVRFARQAPQNDAGDDQIKVIFPSVYEQTPFTALSWRSAAGGVKWQTVHAYPGQHEIVYVCSESTFYVK